MPAKFTGRPLGLTADRAVAVAEILDPKHVIVAHQTHWAHFGQGLADTTAAFEAAGQSAVVRDAPLGRWALLS